MRRLLCFLVSSTSIISVLSWAAIDLSDTDLPVTSSLGMRLMSKARRLEQNDESYSQVQTKWISGYSIKFLACHHIQQWNDEVFNRSDVRIKMKRLVRFRLCPSHTCTSHNAGGCLDGYGDYIIDLTTFMDAYFEATKQATDYECKHYYNKNCMCDENDDDDDEAFDVETCAYDCYAAAGLEKSCAVRNPHFDDSYQTEEFEPSRYMECARFQHGQYNGTTERRHRRTLGEMTEDDGNTPYYVGPFCRHQGGTVMLGMFTDDTCSEFADKNHGKDTFRELAGGLELPYSHLSLIGSKCITCMNQEEKWDEENEEDDGQKNLPLDACQSIYSEAGKCESRLKEETVEIPNTSACRYIQGIKNVRQDGIATGSSGPNGTVNLLIVLFAFSCAALGHYVQYLRKIMKHKKIARALLP